MFWSAKFEGYFGVNGCYRALIGELMCDTVDGRNPAPPGMYKP